jgi:hypothetical protein
MRTSVIAEVAMSSNTGSWARAGLAMANAWFPSTFVRPPGAGSNGAELLMPMPIMSCLAASIAKWPSVPAEVVLRTAASPIPWWRALSTARFIARTPTT